MKSSIQSVLNYFAYFSYPPSFDEIHIFFPKKIAKKNLQKLLDIALKRKILVRLPNDVDFRPMKQSILGFNLELECPRYTLPQYSTQKKNILKLKNQIQKNRSFSAIQTYISLLKIFPLVRFVGITGRSAMQGLQNNDDLDLCIVTKNGFLWTARFFSVLLAKMLRIHGGSGVCLNLFFDESDLLIAKKKQNSYIAHEILQMKPIIDKNHVYDRFFVINKWLYAYFPNSRMRGINSLRKDFSPVFLRPILPLFENMAKRFQLPIIRRNHTAFSISPTQLWLFKTDFEKKLKRRGLVI